MYENKYKNSLGILRAKAIKPHIGLIYSVGKIKNILVNTLVIKTRMHTFAIQINPSWLFKWYIIMYPPSGHNS